MRLTGSLPSLRFIFSSCALIRRASLRFSCSVCLRSSAASLRPKRSTLGTMVTSSSARAAGAHSHLSSRGVTKRTTRCGSRPRTLLAASAMSACSMGRLGSPSASALEMRSLSPRLPSIPTAASSSVGRTRHAHMKPPISASGITAAG